MSIKFFTHTTCLRDHGQFTCFPAAAAATTTAAATAAAARTAGTMMIQRDTASNSVTQQD